MEYNKKIIANFELMIILVSIFSFAYMMGELEKNFNEFEEKYNEILKENSGQSNKFYLKNNLNIFDQFSNLIFEKLKDPFIPLASAQEVVDSGAGCCLLAETGEKCATTTTDTCDPNSPFALGSLCTTTSFCRKGCCYNEDLGIFDSNVLESDCKETWSPDTLCNFPEAERGCCVLGSKTKFETLGQCQIDTEVLALGNSSVVDWRSDLSEAQCILFSQTQKEGACIFQNKECSFQNEPSCINSGGIFYEDSLCTSSFLDTRCKPTKQTACVDGKDGVYFVDSCGNIANIYDSNKVNDLSYWDTVIETDNSCEADSNNGNANSETCGNCNRFLGGLCSSSIDDGFDIEWGTNYCKPTECVFNGETYKNGESWCQYDGKTGDGDDVPGSRHWKYVCNQGEVDIEPCADYRNQICIQQTTFDYEGKEIEFRNAACIANNWRECINLNSEEDGLERCQDALNCQIKQINISEHYTFNVCSPKYPAGFAINDERYQDTAKSICAIGSRNCTVVRVATFTGFGCKWVANKECLNDEFANQMNDVCRSLGDCGASVNYEGIYTENFNILRDDEENPPELTQAWLNHLKTLDDEHPGIYADVEDYSKFLEAAGVFGKAPVAPTGSDAEYPRELTTAAVGLGGVAMAGAYAAVTYSSLSLTTSMGPLVSSSGISAVPAASIGAFSGVAIGASIGFIVGVYLAKLTGSSPLGVILMGSGGALIGGAVAYVLIFATLTTIPLAGWIIAAIGAILMIIGSLFGSADCDPIEVSFECKVWQPPRGGSDCEKCNEDPLRPCSEYRCSTLGAACELINKGTENELCVDVNPGDVTPPRISPNKLNILGDQEYTEITSSGFKITNEGQICIDAYDLLFLAVKTDEPAICKFDFKESNYEEMDFDFGNVFSYNHTIAFPLPDPSHGESQGLNWSGDLDIYLKCQDRYGNENPNFYLVSTCVNQGPDVTPPVVRATFPKSGDKISFDSLIQRINIITNELATCRWDSNDISYDLMTNSLKCTDRFARPSTILGYSCSGEVPAPNTENNFYIRCKDQPWLANEEERNPMTQGYHLLLNKPTSKIKIDSVSPKGEIITQTDQTSIELEIITSGGGDYHACSYSFSGYENMIELFETGADRIHKQPLSLSVGKRDLYVECFDETGDTAKSQTNFTLIKDELNPLIARIWQEDTGELYFITTEIAECRYSESSCSFVFENATLTGKGLFHIIDAIKGRNYFIKCRDEKGNVPSDCSIEAAAI